MTRKILIRLAVAGFAVPPLFVGGAYGLTSAGNPVGLAVPGEVLDLNEAAPADLAALPGMGAAYARRVVEGRPYSAKNQLVTRGILPASAYEQIKDRVVAHRPPSH